jgi:hypothetical protein
MQQKLILEGMNDVHVISNLLVAKKLDITGYENKIRYEKEFISVGNGKQKALKALDTAIKSRQLDIIGIVIDADSEGANPVLQTWQSILGILQRNGYQNLPTQPHSSGTIIQQNGKARIGVWLMPDNINEGYLEHFFGQLIVENDPFLIEATQITEGFIAANRHRFSPIHLQKATIRTWLAWQKDPELSMGLALRDYSQMGFIDLENDLANRFYTWLTSTFDTHQSLSSIQ